MEKNKVGKQESLAFFGTVTASVTHELINVISIINELAGLLDDMLHAAEHSKPIDMDRLGSLYDRLNRQVVRGEKTVKRLNMFAHSTDEEKSVFDVNSVLANFVSLMQRLAERNKVSLKFDNTGQSLNYTGNSFEFQHAVFHAIGLLLKVSPLDSVIELTALKEKDNIKIEVTGSDIPPGELNDSDLTMLRILVDNQGGGILTREGENKFSIIITLPIAY